MTAPIGAFTGTASNIDTKAIVDAIISAERRPAQLMERSISTLTTRKSAWGAYRTILNDINTAAKALRSGTAFGGRTTSVAGTAASGRPILSATAGSTSTPGIYNVEVQSLARSGTGNTAAQALATAPILTGGATTASLTLNGTTITVDATNNSLEGLRDTINSTTAANVSAYIVQTGSGASLVLKAKTSGANGLAFTETTGTGLLTSLGWTADAGADASLVVDGVPVTRSTNNVSDVIPGVTLSLQTAELGTTTQVTVSRDQSSARTAIESFVTAYNKLLDFNKAQIPSGAANATTRPALASETALASQSANLSRTLQEAFGSGAAATQTLSQAGLAIGRDGKLTFSAAKYDALSAADSTGVQALFSDRMTATSTYLDSLVQSTSGNIALQTQSIDRQVTRLTERVGSFDSRLANRRASLTRQFVAMEAALSRIRNQSTAVAGQLATLAGG
jgi:flagellar hook-associated protein 2